MFAIVEHAVVGVVLRKTTYDLMSFLCGNEATHLCALLFLTEEIFLLVSLLLKGCRLRRFSAS